MEIDALRQIPLEDFLARLGHEPVRRRGNEWWYAAPYRTERTPSFRVNVDKQLWYDFGLGKGGDIFTLAGVFVHSCDFMEQVKFITEAGIVPLPQTEPRPHKAVGKKPAFSVLESLWQKSSGRISLPKPLRRKLNSTWLLSRLNTK